MKSPHLTLVLPLCACLWLSSLGTMWGQSSPRSYLKGTLMDQENQTPIAYANLIPLGQAGSGTLTNVNGLFLLNWSGESDSVVIRHLNYGPITLGIEAIRDTVWLSPIPIELDEVPIFSKSPQDLWKRVIEHLDENHYHEEVAYAVDSRGMFYRPDQ
ncbi:MAG: hypothetical protein AAF399_28705, partial [Bacteroidota bacterium]